MTQHDEGSPVEARESVGRTGDDTDRAGAVLDGRYRVLSRLGAGGFGVVYLAEHVALQRRVAIKLLEIQGGRRPQVRDRFVREARLGAAVRHPNVVSIHDFGFLEEEGGVPFMVMDFLEGEEMSVALDRDLWEPSRAARIFSDILSGLGALHDLGIVHRDLKPENVFMVEEDGRDFPVLLDFGISRSLGKVDGLKSAVPTRDDIVQGTPHYMSPEQAQGRAVDARSDVYSAGVLLYEALSGELPFDGESPFDVVMKVVTAEARPLELAAPHVPDPLVQVVERAMAKDPAERFEDARHMRAALDEAVAESGISVLTSLDGWSFDGSGVRAVRTVSESRATLAPSAVPPSGEDELGDLPTQPAAAPLPPDVVRALRGEPPADAPSDGLVDPRPRRPWLALGLVVAIVGAGGVWLLAPREAPIAADSRGEASSIPRGVDGPPAVPSAQALPSPRAERDGVAAGAEAGPTEGAPSSEERSPATLETAPGSASLPEPSRRAASRVGRRGAAETAARRRAPSERPRPGVARREEGRSGAVQSEQIPSEEAVPETAPSVGAAPADAPEDAPDPTPDHQLLRDPGF
ncbi:MAG: protein kinase [Sandaracinaceae bacterium]